MKSPFEHLRDILVILKALLDAIEGSSRGGNVCQYLLAKWLSCGDGLRLGAGRNL